MFATSELSRRGAVLQGIDNVFVCCYYQDGNEVQDGELVPFPSMIKEKCPVRQCFLVQVFLDIETLVSQIYAKLNQRGEQQGELTSKILHPHPICTGMIVGKLEVQAAGSVWHPCQNWFFLHPLMHDMKCTKVALLGEDVDVMHVPDETHLVLLRRSILGSTICCCMGSVPAGPS